MNRNEIDLMEYPAEYFQWLAEKNVKKKHLRRNPELFRTYFDEWARESQQSKRRKGIQLPKFDLNKISSSADKVYGILNIVQSIRNIFPTFIKK